MENRIAELGCIFGVVVIVQLAFILSAVKETANGTERIAILFKRNMDGDSVYELRVRSGR